MNEEEQNTPREHNIASSIGTTFVVFLVCAALVVIMIFTIRACALSDGNAENSDGISSITRRSANVNDIVVNYEIDIPNLSCKYVIMPQVDINNLRLKIDLCDKDYNNIYTTERYIGNVVKGNQCSFSISLFEVGLNAVNIEYTKWTVTGGTVSNFAF